MPSFFESQFQESGWAFLDEVDAQYPTREEVIDAAQKDPVLKYKYALAINNQRLDAIMYHARAQADRYLESNGWDLSLRTAAKLVQRTATLSLTVSELKKYYDALYAVGEADDSYPNGTIEVVREDESRLTMPLEGYEPQNSDRIIFRPEYLARLRENAGFPPLDAAAEEAQRTASATTEPPPEAPPEPPPLTEAQKAVLETRSRPQPGPMDIRYGKRVIDYLVGGIMKAADGDGAMVRRAFVEGIIAAHPRFKDDAAALGAIVERELPQRIKTMIAETGASGDVEKQGKFSAAFFQELNKAQSRQPGAASPEWWTAFENMAKNDFNEWLQIPVYKYIVENVQDAIASELEGKAPRTVQDALIQKAELDPNLSGMLRDLKEKYLPLTRTPKIEHWLQDPVIGVNRGKGIPEEGVIRMAFDTGLLSKNGRYRLSSNGGYKRDLRPEIREAFFEAFDRQIKEKLGSVGVDKTPPGIVAWRKRLMHQSKNNWAGFLKEPVDAHHILSALMNVDPKKVMAQYSPIPVLATPLQPGTKPAQQKSSAPADAPARVTETEKPVPLPPRHPRNTAYGPLTRNAPPHLKRAPRDRTTEQNSTLGNDPSAQQIEDKNKPKKETAPRKAKPLKPGSDAAALSSP